MSELRKYGAATTLIFPLVDRGTVDFESTPATFASGDTKIVKDEGAAANTTNNPVHEGNGLYSLALTATEMQAARIAVTLIDSATKTWEDQAVIIDTYGHTSAQHALDLDDAQLDVNVAAMNANAIAVGVIANNAIGSGQLAQDAIGGAQFNAHLKVADAVLRRATSDIEAGWAPDARTLYGVIAALTHKHSRDASAITLYRSDDSTVLVTIPITTSKTLDPISQLDPP